MLSFFDHFSFPKNWACSCPSLSLISSHLQRRPRLMAQSQYLIFWNLRGSEPVFLPVLTYSIELSRGSRYDRQDRFDQPEESLKTWDCATTVRYVRDKGFAPETVEMFAKEKIDGQGLFMLGKNTKLVSELPLSSWGERLRLANVAEEAYEISREKRLQLEDAQITTHSSTNFSVSLLAALARKQRFGRISIVQYTGPTRDRWGGVNEEGDIAGVPRGTPLILIDLYDCAVTTSNFSNEKQAQVNVEPRKLVYSTRGYLDFDGLSFEAYDHWHLTRDNKPREASVSHKLEHALGSSVMFDLKNDTTSVIEFASDFRWSKEHHFLFPLEFKRMVMALMILQMRGDNVFSLLAKDCLLMIIQLCQEGYNADPFASLPTHPGKKSSAAPDAPQFVADDSSDEIDNFLDSE